MGRALRAETFSATEVVIVHVCKRCVRRAFLVVDDPVTGKSFEFRREWIRRRLELLNAAFGLDVLTYAIIANHLHVVLRTRPDVVETWSDEEAARRWLRLFPGKRLEEHLGEPAQADVHRLVNDAKKLKRMRLRLTDVSWFMRALAEPIARLANKQDQVTGRFWEGRFRAQKIVDESGLLACPMYVDLNPIRAAMAATPEESRYTSAYDRIEGLKGREQVSAAGELPPVTAYEESLEAEIVQAKKTGEEKSAPAASRAKLAQARTRKAKRAKGANRIARDGWLSPLEPNERGPLGPQTSPSGIRASDQGFLALNLKDCLKLLDWTGRQGRADKRGKIPAALASILERIGIDSSM